MTRERHGVARVVWTLTWPLRWTVAWILCAFINVMDVLYWLAGGPRPTGVLPWTERHRQHEESR
jgi:hypothetical protein